MRVLLASDGSAFSLQAARFLGRWLPSDRSVRVDVTTVLAPGGQEAAEGGHGASNGAVTAVEELGAEIEAALASSSMTAWHRILFGGPAELLVQNSSSYDLVVAGVKGSGALPFVELGTVARALLRHAECSVLLVREEPTSARTDSRDGKRSDLRILLPTDGREEGLQAAWELLEPFSVLPADVDVVPQIEPGSGLARKAAESRADLVILGATGSGPDRPAPLETFDREVAWRAPCSVLMLRRPNRSLTIPRREDVRVRAPSTQRSLVTAQTAVS